MSDQTPHDPDGAPAPGADPAGTASVGPVYSTRAKLVLVLVAALAGLAFVAAYVVSDTGVEGDTVTATGGAAPLAGFGVRPLAGSEALRQAEIGIDLLPGWAGALIVDGVEIPRSELRIVEAESQFFFTPGEGKSVERLPGGRNCVTAIVWQLRNGRGVDDEQFTWCFQVL